MIEISKKKLEDLAAIAAMKIDAVIKEAEINSGQHNDIKFSVGERVLGKHSVSFAVDKNRIILVE